MEHQTFQQINFIETAEPLYGVDIMQDSIVATQNKSVTVLSLDGTRSNRIGNCQLFSFLAVSKTREDNPFLHCCDGDCVVKYTLDGNEVIRHNLPNIKAARGIAADKARNIYVCGKDSHNVLFLSKNGMSRYFCLKRMTFTNLIPEDLTTQVLGSL